jgi:hypothetical protein
VHHAASRCARPTEKHRAVRTFFAVALQLARVFPRLVDLVRATANADTAARRRAAIAIARAVVDGARDRSASAFMPSLLALQRQDMRLSRSRPRRPGRTSQALAARRRCNR